MSVIKIFSFSNMNVIELKGKNLMELKTIAKELGIKRVDSFRKEELISKIVDVMAAQQNKESSDGGSSSSSLENFLDKMILYAEKGGAKDSEENDEATASTDEELPSDPVRNIHNRIRWELLICRCGCLIDR